MSKHTPGPWVVGDYSDFGQYIWDPKVQRIVAETYPDEHQDFEANACLIAAAPELLEIAKLILKEWNAPTDGVARGELIGRLSQYAIEARKVIKKAEGK